MLLYAYAYIKKQIESNFFLRFSIFDEYTNDSFQFHKNSTLYKTSVYQGYTLAKIHSGS